MENEKIIKKQNFRVTVFAFILSFIAIGILVFGFTLISSDKVVLIQSISNLYNKVVSIDDETSTLFDKLSSSKNLGILTSINYKNNENSYDLSLSYIENKDDKKNSLNIKINDSENELLNGNVLLNNSKAYLFFNKITPDYLSIDYNYFEILNSLSGNDYDKVVSLLKEAIDSNISDKDITKVKTTIPYNGKEKKVNKLTYKIDTKTLSKILDKFIKSLKKDKVLLNHISDVVNMDSKELTKTLDKYLKELNKVENTEILTYSTYYYGFNKIVKYDIEFNYIDCILSYITEDKSNTFNIKLMGNEILTITSKKNKKEYTYEGSMINIIEPLLLNKEFDLSTITSKIMFDGKYSNNTLDLNIHSDNNYHVKLSKNVNIDNNQFKYTATIEDLSNEYEVNMGFEFLIDKKVEIEENIESKNLNELTEEEKEEIKTNLINTPIYNYISNFINFE